jgi:adenosylcobinamide amidohydrolase
MEMEEDLVLDRRVDAVAKRFAQCKAGIQVAGKRRYLGTISISVLFGNTFNDACFVDICMCSS